MPLPTKLLEQGVRDMVRICDGRMSGTAYGTVVLHVAPEAAAGGPLALVRTGDVISLDVEARRIDVEVPDDELARRTPDAATVAGFADPRRGWERLYVDHVLQADTGADLDFLVGSPRTPARWPRCCGSAPPAGVPLTFRSGGTSLSGQAATDGVLVDTRRTSAPSRCSTTAPASASSPAPRSAQVNARLARYGRKLGPDPASESPARSAAWSPTTPAAWPAAPSQHLPHARVGRPGAAERHGDRHRRPDADERLRRSSRTSTRAGSAARPRPRRPSVGRAHRSSSPSRTPWATASTPSSTTTGPSTSSPTWSSAARARSAFVAEATFRTVPVHPGTPPPGCWSSTTSRGHRLAARAGRGRLRHDRAAGRHQPAGGPGRPERRRPARARRVRPRRAAGRVPGADRGGARRPRSPPPTLVRRLPAARRPVLSTDAGGAGRAVAHPQGPLHRGRRRPALRHDRAAGGHRGPGRPAAGRPARRSPSCSTGTATTSSVIFGHAKDGNIHFMLNEDFDRPS